MKLFATIFTVIGLFLLSIALHLFKQEIAFLKKAQTATGKVIDLGVSYSSSKNSSSSPTYYPIVTFHTPEGKPYTFRSNFSSNPPSYEEGEEVEVYYLPDSPAKAEIKGFFSQWFAVLICSVIGLIFSAIGLGTWVNMFRSNKLNKWLRVNGRMIQTRVQSVELNTSLKINGKSPYVIYTQWHNPSNNKVHVFKSKNIFYDPASYIPGDIIPVLVDPNNYKKYYMDTTFLPVLN
jgi:hypothetical protein